MRKRNLLAAQLALLVAACAWHAQAQERYAIGRDATSGEIAGWNIDVGGNDGSNLPAGSGTVERGKTVFAEQCASCHGDKGQGGIGDRLVGGEGTLATPKPVKTVGSYWPYAPTLFDYIRRAMPMNAPQSLSDTDVYAASAYVLHLNGLLPADATLDAKSLSAIKMPNRDKFVGDPRPDVKPSACMKDC
jgi:cytochrome c